MRSASAERSGSPRSNNVAVLEHRPALNRGDNSRSIHDPIRGRIDRLAEIQSKSDRLLGGRYLSDFKLIFYSANSQAIERM
jgi:hypothetical protein